jgi:polyhydroxyalkanoate synthesis regulator phasin
MRKLLALGLGASLLLVGTGAVLAQTTTTPAPAASTAPSGDPGLGHAPSAAARPSLLDKVLKELVADGTLQQGQADKILGRLKTERDALRADASARREAAKALRQQIRDFLKDGVITADELAKLPADDPLRNLDKVLDDGKITLDELRQLGIGRIRDVLGKHGLRHLGGGDDAHASPSASPAG